MLQNFDYMSRPGVTVVDGTFGDSFTFFMSRLLMHSSVGSEFTDCQSGCLRDFTSWLHYYA